MECPVFFLPLAILHLMEVLVAVKLQISLLQKYMFSLMEVETAYMFSLLQEYWQHICLLQELQKYMFETAYMFASRVADI